MHRFHVPADNVVHQPSIPDAYVNSSQQFFPKYPWKSLIFLYSLQIQFHLVIIACPMEHLPLSVATMIM